MATRATDGTCLAVLVRMAKPLCQSAERVCRRQIGRRGRPPQFADWVIALLIMVCVLRKKKSKSAQYRFIQEHWDELKRWAAMRQLPGRTTYFDRYRRAWKLYEVAIRLQGEQLVREGIVDATVVAVDKSLIAARGPRWHQKHRRQGKVPKGLGGVDRDSAWGYSEHDGWVQGYSYEVLVNATRGCRVAAAPLLASADTAALKEYASFGPKIPHLPKQTRDVLADSGYDTNAYGQRIEYDDHDRRSGRHFLCPPNIRNAARCKTPPADPKLHVPWKRRQLRIAHYRSRRGRALFRRRCQSVEPFNEWFKKLFELDQRVWHRGLDNNRTQLLAAIFSYQLLLRYNHRRGRHNGQIMWIIDAL